MSKPPRIYSDANPIIEMAKWAKNTHDPARLLDLQTMDQLLKAANDSHIDLFTSSVSVAECVSADDDCGQDVQDFFVGVLTSGRMFKLIQADIFIAEKARDLRWQRNIKLKGMDAIHIASAIEYGCTEFLTWDLDMGKPKVSQKHAHLHSLGVRCITPAQTTLLPPLYGVNFNLQP